MVVPSLRLTAIEADHFTILGKWRRKVGAARPIPPIQDAPVQIPEVALETIKLAHAPP